jgi:tetratricopeptide (TPR) repeat protein
MNRVLCITLILLLAAGCQSVAKQKTQKQTATDQWNAARASVLYSLAQDQYATGNFDKCRESLDDALKLQPNSAKLRILSGKLAIEQGQLDVAEKELALARAADPTNAEADYLAGVVAQRWQQLDRAYEFYTAASDKAPAELAYLLARAETLVSLDRSEEALKLLEEKVVFFEHSSAIRQAVGQLLVQHGRYEEASKMLRQATILSPDDLGLREQLGMAMFYANNYREAGDVLARVIDHEKYADRADLLLAMGECRLQTGQLREARGLLLKASERMPWNPTVWLSLSKASMELEDHDRAELAIRKALALDPASSQAYLMQGYLRLKQNRLPNALVAFRKASALDGGDTVSLCMIGYVLEKQGRPDEAMQFYARALQIQPKDELASRLMASVQIGE